LNLVGHFASRFLELLNALAQALGQIRNFLGAEKDQNQRQDYHDLAAT